MTEEKNPFEEENIDMDILDDLDDDFFNFDDEENEDLILEENRLSRNKMAPSTASTEETNTFDFDEETDLDETNEDSKEEESSSSPSSFKEKLNHLASNNPKTLIKYVLGGLLVLVLASGGLISLFKSKPQSEVAPSLQPVMTRPLNSPSTNPEINKVSSPSKTLTPVTPPQTQANSLNGLEPTSAVTVPTTNPDIADNPTLPSSNIDNGQLTAMENDNITLKNKVAELESTINQLNTVVVQNQQMNQSNQTQIATLIQSMSTLQTQVNRLNQALATIINAARQSNGMGMTNSGNGVTSGGNTSIASTPYYVQAIIPGRAWLKTNQGQTVTVGVGDAIPGYGIVTQIDAQNGLVITSTGAKIVFGIDEG